MTSPRTPGVLVLTQEIDPHADRVIDELERMGVRSWRVHTSDFPLDMTLSAEGCAPAWSGSLRWEGAAVELGDVTSVWFRRPTRFRIDPRLGGSRAAFTVAECRMAFGGLLRALPVSWVSHPESIVSADYKPHQLALAARLGFTVPRTVITNDPQRARDFLRTTGRSIYKPLSSVLVGIDEGEPLVQYTREIDSSDDEALESVRFAPCLFQERIDKAYEMRVVVMGPKVFAVEIHAGSEATALDWRSDYSRLTYRPHVISPALESLCLRLVRNLDLSFGAIDLAVRPDGEVVFFEINSNGQWAWLEEAVPELPMTHTMASLLAGSEGDHVA
ncbi:MAG TPA: hypothetical protein VFP72_03635 [Kineosporiaceae bacterium]|nr:hypothetical protein [Kineosporiaceae bacterium]